MIATPRSDCPGAWVVVSGGNAYDVRKTLLGWECDCGHWVWKLEHTGKPCKHIALVEAL